MKTSSITTAAWALLGLLSGPALSAKATQQQAKIQEGGYTFKVSRYNDGRTRPYRVFFWDDHLTGSSYRLDADGHVRYFKAGSEVYYDRVDMGDYSAAFRKKREGKKMPPPGKAPDDEDLPGLNCDECSTALAAVCDSGLPKFCNAVEESILGSDGKKSVDSPPVAATNSRKTKLATNNLTAPESDDGATCSNGVVGVESSNGKACCVADCGTCGGVGCSVFGAAFGLDSDDCCATEASIADDGDLCSETGVAPCAIDNAVEEGERRQQYRSQPSCPPESDDVESDDGATCSNGVVGLESSNGKACCVTECGVCGGEGCSGFGADFGLDAHDCCATEIADEGDLCTTTGMAPCAIDNVVMEGKRRSKPPRAACAFLQRIMVFFNGVVGLESSNGKACCVTECGVCGGEGCSGFGADFGLDAHDCCATEIVDEGTPCFKTGVSPCYISDVVTHGERMPENETARNHLAAPEPSEDDVSTCSNDVVGVESSNGKACCVAECGACGGEGCSGFGVDFGLDAHDCCATEIADEGESCSETGEAPCFIGDTVTKGKP
ncbi:unnamed protein product [Scytosiphon promiscuus]